MERIKLTNHIVVLGSINVDTTYRVKHFPQPGETISVVQKRHAPGGKGANQAVAAARSDAQVTFVGAVGADNDGSAMVKALVDNKIDTSQIIVDPKQGTGSAVITVDDNGQNEIMVYGGANQALNSACVANLTAALSQAEFLIAQLETPQEVTLAAFKQAHQFGVTTVLNPAPATDLLPELYQYTDLIIPNETESALLTGIRVNTQKDLQASTERFAQRGIANVLITLGERGVYYSTAQGAGLIPAFQVQAIDTTAAGDTFIGALCAQLLPDLTNLPQAIKYAQYASSLAVQRMGALPSIPLAAEIIKGLDQHN